MLIEQTGRAEPRAVFARCPTADGRDINRAIEVLVAEGSLASGHGGAPSAELGITDRGRWRLASYLIHKVQTGV
jgi:hypothetical protein